MAITAPMLAQLGVNDVSQSLAFYRDVLGFNVNWEHQENGHIAVAELQLGAAKLQLAKHDGVLDTPDQRSARHSIILFFETDSVDTLHQSTVRRGGHPAKIEAGDYWIKMRFFEITDPDNHALWFGERVA